MEDGAYFCNNIDCFKKAIKSNRIEKEFSCSLSEETINNIENDFNS